MSKTKGPLPPLHPAVSLYLKVAPRHRALIDLVLERQMLALTRQDQPFEVGGVEYMFSTLHPRTLNDTYSARVLNGPPLFEITVLGSTTLHPIARTALLEYKNTSSPTAVAKSLKRNVTKQESFA